MIQSNRKYLHWDYYLSLEEDLFKLARYIDLSQENFGTYSIELTRILQIACSEFDVVAKLLCKSINNNGTYRNINDYRGILSTHIPSIISETVYSRRYGLELTPFFNWGNQENSDWWNAYNKVKHNRDNNFSKANLKNALNAVAGLHVIIVYLYLNGENISENNSNIKDLFHEISNNSKESEFFTLNYNYYYHRLVV